MLLLTLIISGQTTFVRGDPSLIMLTLLFLASVHALGIFPHLCLYNVILHLTMQTSCLCESVKVFTSRFIKCSPSSCPRGSSEIKARAAGWNGRPPPLGRRADWPGQVHLLPRLLLDLVRRLGWRVRVGCVHLDPARWRGVEGGGRSSGGRGWCWGGGSWALGRLTGSLRDKGCHHLGAGSSVGFWCLEQVGRQTKFPGSLWQVGG